MALLRLSCTPYRSLRLGAASAGNSSFRPICGSRLFPAGDILKAPGSTSLSQTISLLCSTSRLIQRHNLLQHLRHPALPAARLLATAASDQPARTPQPQAVPNSRNEWTEEAEASIEEKGEHRQWAGGGGYVHTSAQVHPSVRVEPAAVVQAGASIGPGSVIGAGSVVGPGVTVGSATTLGPLVTLQHCTVGDRCTLHSGVRVGQDGFGFFVNECGEMVKKPQILAVRIGHDVEIGANSCIDRGSWRDTVIGDHCKLDNLVQIGHNVVLGRCCILCGQVGIGGSATLGDYVVLGGQAGVADHVSIPSKVRVAAKSGVTASIKEPGDYAGFPAVPAREWRRAAVWQRRRGRYSTGASE